ncbi:RNA-directed DNA polymerase, eukaryota [Tanacetum coccineum]
MSTGLSVDLPSNGCFFLDQGGSNEGNLSDRSLLLKELNDINYIDSLEAAQKSKVRWAIEGDENKNEEIKSVVWDCGTNKSPGPGGFTFELFRRYWKLLEHDIVAVVKEFFASVDFEKAFDSIRWDYLQDILKMFGFGDKRCDWINGCLNSAMGSVLVNGSLTSEFQFHKDLKQENPLSPFLFILIMESLHFYFSKVTNAGLFLGILIDSSLTLSHIFFADDVIFVEEVEAAATTMGCSNFTISFVHLGVKTRFIKSIYGEDGALNSPSSLSKRSPWLDIIREVIVLRTKGINLLDSIRKKVGNGLTTLFWEDPWLDDLALKHKFSRLYAFDNYKQITVVKKINHTSMVDTFRRPPRGGAEEEQLGFLLCRMDGLILTNIPDHWV